MWIKLFLGWCGAYLLGSIPSGIAWSWLAKRIDVRQHGSGRTGGTNVWRSAGFWPLPEPDASQPEKPDKATIG